MELASSHQAGFSPVVSDLSGVVEARKRVIEVQVEFAQSAIVVQTLEGPVTAGPGDAIITGIRGERWPVSSKRFAQKYEPVPPLVAGQDGRYRTRSIIVHAVAIQEAFAVTLPDKSSRLEGRAGDWLVDYGDGSLGVVAAEVFAATYEVECAVRASNTDDDAPVPGPLNGST